MLSINYDSSRQCSATLKTSCCRKIFNDMDKYFPYKFNLFMIECFKYIQNSETITPNPSTNFKKHLFIFNLTLTPITFFYSHTIFLLLSPSFQHTEASPRAVTTAFINISPTLSKKIKIV